MKNIFFLFFLLSIHVNAQKSDFKHINFKKADSIANYYKNENLKSLPLLAYHLTSKLKTDVEKFRAIFIWVSKNIEGDHSLVMKNTKKRKRFKNNITKLNLWNTSLNKVMFKKLLQNKKTVCTGYAYLVRELASLSNIECKIIDGFGRNTTANIGKLSIPNHSWNAVKLNNKWYLADATWASGYTDLNKNIYVFDYNDGYFLANPKLFIKNHFPNDKKWSLIKNQSLTTENFINAPLIYGGTFKNNILPVFPKKMNNSITKNEEIIFQLNSKEVINLDKITIQIGENSVIVKTKPISVTRQKEVISINYKFKIKGSYDVHLLYDKDVIATYTFKVKN